jgi:hypothetical protein
MIKFGEIKVGDYVQAEYEGQLKQGEVIELNGDEKQVCVQTDVQSFWFDTEHLQPIVLSDEALQKLHFTKHENEDGSVKYMKGAFRIITPQKNNFENAEMWYREDVRHNPQISFVHQLQNKYYDMTKVHLTSHPM